MNLSVCRTAAVAVAGMALCMPAAQAQTMYRCGKQYQDRPCDAGQQGRAVGSATSSRPAVPAAADAECAQRGNDAVKIVWAREGGATAERLLSEIDEKKISMAQKAEEKRLVADVYRKRGTPPEVRAAIQADCVAEKERAAQAAALAAAAAKLQGQNPGAAVPAAPAGASSEEMKPASERSRDTRAANDAERKRRLCASLSSRLEENRSAARAGGTIGTMEGLRNEGRRIEMQIRDAGC